MKTYSQLSYEQRCQISIPINIGFSQQMIADVVGVSQPTISRELKRNTGQRGYRETQAQAKSYIRRQKAEKFIKMTPAMIALIESKLEVKWSPEEPAPRSALGTNIRLAVRGERSAYQ